jgi:hypothetical protein
MSENEDRPTRQRDDADRYQFASVGAPGGPRCAGGLRQLKGFDYVLRKMSG